MKFLALEHELPVATTEAFQPLLKNEARHVWELQQSGKLREIYFNADQHTAVLVLECSRCRRQRGSYYPALPLVAVGLIEFEIIPLAPYDGLPGCLPEKTKHLSGLREAPMIETLAIALPVMTIAFFFWFFMRMRQPRKGKNAKVDDRTRQERAVWAWAKVVSSSQEPVNTYRMARVSWSWKSTCPATRLTRSRPPGWSIRKPWRSLKKAKRFL